MAKRIISVEISDELRSALKHEAYKRDLSLSALIRAILEETILSIGASADEE